MRFTDYCDAINATLVVTRYPNQGERWSAKLEHAEVKEEGVLVGTYGNGKTADDAVRDYIKQIQGKTLVFCAYTARRRELTVPTIFHNTGA